MKKNILSENMRRFGTKNLNEQNLAGSANTKSIDYDTRKTADLCSIEKVVKDLTDGTRWIPGFETAAKEEVNKSSFHGIALTVLGDTVTSSVNNEIFQHKYQLNIYKDDNGNNKWTFGMYVEDTNGNIKLSRQSRKNPRGEWICTSDTYPGGIQLGMNGIDVTDDLKIEIDTQSAGNAKNK